MDSHVLNYSLNSSIIPIPLISSISICQNRGTINQRPLYYFALHVQLIFSVTNHRFQEQRGDKFDCGPLIRPRAVCGPFREIQEDEINARVSIGCPSM